MDQTCPHCNTDHFSVERPSWSQFTICWLKSIETPISLGEGFTGPNCSHFYFHRCYPSCLYCIVYLNIPVAGKHERKIYQTNPFCDPMTCPLFHPTMHFSSRPMRSPTRQTSNIRQQPIPNNQEHSFCYNKLNLHSRVVQTASPLIIPYESLFTFVISEPENYVNSKFQPSPSSNH